MKEETYVFGPGHPPLDAQTFAAILIQLARAPAPDLPMTDRIDVLLAVCAHLAADLPVPIVVTHLHRFLQGVQFLHPRHPHFLFMVSHEAPVPPAPES